MTQSTLILLGIMLLGILGRSNVIALAAALLIVLQMANVPWLYPALERRGLELGLVFLVISVLVPFADGRVQLGEVWRSSWSLPGVIALISGLLATIMNGQGLTLLKIQPEMMMGLVVGSILGVVFLGGIPVGPLMAGGIAAMLMAVLNWLLWLLR